MKKKGIAGDTEVARRVRMARGAGNLTLGQMADEVSQILDTPLSREIIRRVELGERDAEIRLLWAIAQATGESFEFLTEPLSTLDKAIPGSLNSQNGHRSRINHELGGCVGCLLDPNFHISGDYTEEDGWDDRPKIPGQTEIIIDLTAEPAFRFAKAG